MKKLFLSMGVLAVGYSYAQKISWQKDGNVSKITMT